MSVVYVVAAVSVTVLAALVTPARTQPTSSESTALAGTAWTVVELAGGPFLSTPHLRHVSRISSLAQTAACPGRTDATG
jgi:hypothetical protein